MNMVEEQKSKLFILGIFPKCPFYKPVPLLIILVLIALGTWGIHYLNLWVAVAYLIYAILWYFLVMPIFHCRHCYYKVKETTTDNNTGKSIEKLLPKEQWKESCLQKHVECGKKWGVNFFISWFLPIILMVISFFLSFSIFVVIFLIGFIGMVVGNFFYMLKVKCPECPIREYCHSAF